METTVSISISVIPEILGRVLSEAEKNFPFSIPFPLSLPKKHLQKLNLPGNLGAFAEAEKNLLFPHLPQKCPRRPEFAVV
jgi:hypothetical protein